jgi:curved DNA-binding protein CbpA
MTAPTAEFSMTSKDDLYIILEVGRAASVNDIKRAFRKLARRYHPDINPGDLQAEEHFKRITEAYDILSDPLKREFYDVNGFYTDGVLRKRRLDLPKSGYPARVPAPTRSTCRGIGKSVAGLRNCEKRTATTALWVGLQSKRIARTPRSPTQPKQHAW